MDGSVNEVSGALIFALIMVTLVVMCAISMCVAKSQRTKGAQKYAPDGDVPGKRSRNFVKNVQVKQHLKEIDFGTGQVKKGKVFESEMFEKLETLERIIAAFGFKATSHLPVYHSILIIIS
jgi:hypothetical protein